MVCTDTPCFSAARCLSSPLDSDLIKERRTGSFKSFGRRDGAIPAAHAHDIAVAIVMPVSAR